MLARVFLFALRRLPDTTLVEIVRRLHRSEFIRARAALEAELRRRQWAWAAATNSIRPS